MNIEIEWVNLKVVPIHLKCVKITLFILASMGLQGLIFPEILSFILTFLSGNKNLFMDGIISNQTDHSHGAFL